MLLLTGALTSKPYAFTSRPWELRSVQSIDIFDGVGSNIRVDFKESEIVRILPRKNSNINENWISDKIRFFYDGLKRQRINNPYIKVKGELKPLKWEKTFKKLRAVLKVFSFEYGSSSVGVLSGSSIDTETLYTVRNLALSYGFFNLGLDQKLRTDVDNPQNYKFQIQFKDLENVDYCLLLGTNPRFEASTLNLRLRKIFKRGNISLGSVGDSFNTTFPIDFLSLSSSTLASIAEGRHPVCKLIAKAKKPAIILGSGVLFRNDSIAILNMLKYLSSCFSTIFQTQLNFNVLQIASNTVGGLELGIKPFKRDDLKQVKFLYTVGVDNSEILRELKTISNSSIIVYQNCLGNRYTNLADFVLPSTSFIENNGVYYNTEGRPQRTQRAFVGPNLCRDNWKIVTVLHQTLSKSIFYSTRAQLNTVISRILPSFYFADSWFIKTESTLSSSFSFGNIYAERFFKTPLKLLIEDFFMTHGFCQASKVMAKASNTLRSYSTNYKFLDSFS